jgi:hypothetical protein
MSTKNGVWISFPSPERSIGMEEFSMNRLPLSAMSVNRRNRLPFLIDYRVCATDEELGILFGSRGTRGKAYKSLSFYGFESRVAQHTIWSHSIEVSTLGFHPSSRSSILRGTT